MLILLYIALFLAVSFVVWDLSTRKYLNPYKLHFFIGKKGSGKSTLLTKIALQSLKKGRTVFSTEPIPGTYVLKPEDIGFYEFPPNSVILIDEVSLIWPNRDWKKLKSEVVEWFRLQRHRRASYGLPLFTNIRFGREDQRSGGQFVACYKKSSCIFSCSSY